MALRITKRTDNFAHYIKAAPKVARELEEKHVKIWANLMVQIMPEKTGKMKRNTEAVPNRTNKGWGVRIGVNYWKFVNSGWAHFEGYHFVEHSREFVRPDFKRDIKQFIKLVRAA